MNATEQATDSVKPLWVTAQSKQNEDKVQKQRNNSTKREYFRILKGIKDLYKPFSQLAFERNYLTDPSDKSTPMHCFLNNEVYWHLACDESLNFTINFNIADVKLRSEINCLIMITSKHLNLKPVMDPDVPTLFERCRRLQDDKFFYILK